MSGIEVDSFDAGAVTDQTRPIIRKGLPGCNWKLLLLYGFLALAVVAAYYPVHNYAFLSNVDDNGYVFENPRVLGPLNWATIRWAFTHSFLLNYDPLTFLAHSINVHLFALDAGRHHEVNVYLHLLNTLILFCLLRRTTGFTWRSFMVAALFALHPINVENVAWISELKTLLSAVFFFLALGAYRWYAGKPKPWRMLGVGFLFGLGLLAKPQIITLPFVLLLWDYWPLHRMFASTNEPAVRDLDASIYSERKFFTLVLEKWPLWVIALGDALLTMHAAKKKTIESYTLLIRLGTAVRSYVVYLGKALWPTRLAYGYGHPGYSLRWIEVGAALALMLAISSLVWRYRSQRYLIVGWLWFVGTMVPTINLKQIDVAAVADRYAYLSFVGLFVITCWGAAECAVKLKLPRAILPTISTAVLAILLVAVHRQVGYWKDGKALWTRSIEISPNNWASNAGLGTFLMGSGRVDEAVSYLRRALAESPRNSSLMMDLGTAELRRNNFEGAMQYYGQALSVSNDLAMNAEMFGNMATIERRRGQLKEAVVYYRRALAISGDNKMNAQMLVNLGHAYGDLGDATHALECFHKAQRLQHASERLE